MNADALAARIENLLGSSPSSSSERIPSKAPPPIADHEIIARIGAGSYGEVWLARSITGALRAVKVVWRCHFSSERPYEREFHGIVQFEPISRSHPGVVNVLHVGRDDAVGCFFYVMELADDAGQRSDGVMESWSNGQNLASQSSNTPPLQRSSSYSPRTLASELKSRTRLPVTDVVSLGVQLAGALGHLHRHSLVHRDVKPSNVIFVHGQPKLADIGLVTGVHEERSFVGTEGFIPPEGPGSERADLFALGRLLYEAVTGKNRCDFPGLPDDLDRWPKSEREGLIELNEVLARACAPEAKKRHSNAAELAGDMNLILAGRSVRRAYRIERQLRQATFVSVAALVLVFATISSNWLQRQQRERSEAQARREATLREETQKSLARAEAAERQSQQQLYTALLEQGRAVVRSGELGQRVKALDAVRRAAAISNSAALRGVTIAAHVLPDLRFKRELPYGPELIVRLVDPSFERIALGRGRGPVEIRATADQRLLATLPASTNLPANFAVWSPDGRFLAVQRIHHPDGSRTDKEIWSVADPERRLLLRNVAYDGIAFHPRLPRVLVAGTAGVAMWDLEQGAEISRIPLKGTPRWLGFAPEGERFAATYAVGRDRIVSVHRITGELLASNVFDKFVPTFNWHPSGGWLSVPDYGGSVHQMDAQTGEKRLLGGHKAEATRAEFSPDGAYLITGGWERELICWDARTLKRAFTAFLNGWAGRFSADGRAYALETQSGLQLHAFEHAGGHREFAEDLGPRLLSAAFSPDSRWVAAAGRERLGVWDLQNGGPGALAPNAGETRIEFAANGELFADRRGAAFRWRVSPGPDATSPPKLEALELAVPAGFVSLYPVSNGVVMSGARGSALVGHEQLGAEPREWKRSVDGLNGVSPDGRWLAMYRSYTPHLVVHRLPDLERVAILTNAANIHAFEFSPAGDELAVSFRSGGVEFWSTATWQRTRTITNLNSQLYSADGRTMWLMQQVRAGGLHNARTLELLMPLPVGTYPLAVSPDGRRLAVSVDLRRLQVWDLVEVRHQLAQLGLDWQ